MRIVTWNCRGALRNKLKEIAKLRADVLVIQECENPELSTKAYKEWAKNYLWIGNDKNKGIGIFAKMNINIKKLNWDGEFKIQGLNSKSHLLSWKTSDLELFLPFSINNLFTVLAVWTKGKKGEQFNYIGQFWKYLQIHHNQLRYENTFILGDFNSNQKWDKEKRIDAWWNHASVIGELKDIGFESLYHFKTKELQGLEMKSTYFHHKKRSSSHHIDYIFSSKNILSILDFNIERYEDWIKVSDHVPLVMSIKKNNKGNI
ncbi:predicted protein [hydrothermal vent metagenome]|uniref:Uncharacterized protein n=1 Tax=hydrothermal vent metagenome TaxID=652676 RepID=A0A1W1D0X6_9ZZZZ